MISFIEGITNDSSVLCLQVVLEPVPIRNMWRTFMTLFHGIHETSNLIFGLESVK